jgi:hypothetical protein
MNTKHTPGPWTVFNPDDGECHRYPGIDSESETIIIYGNEDEVSGVRGQSKEVAEANARLIAAAPELLEVLVEILPIAETMINSNHPTWKKAKSAIAKATGEKEVAA